MLLAFGVFIHEVFLKYNLVNLSYCGNIYCCASIYWSFSMFVAQVSTALQSSETRHRAFRSEDSIGKRWTVTCSGSLLASAGCVLVPLTDWLYPALTKWLPAEIFRYTVSTPGSTVMSRDLRRVSFGYHEQGLASSSVAIRFHDLVRIHIQHYRSRRLSCVVYHVTWPTSHVMRCVSCDLTDVAPHEHGRAVDIFR